MPKIEVICAICGSHFQRFPSQIGQNSYCSRACLGKAKQNRISLTCENCGRAFERTASRVRDDGHAFCCVECMVKHTRGEHNPNFAGGMKTIVCEECGRSVERLPCHANRCDHSYCSQACMGIASRRRAGNNSALWRSTEVKCDWCGASIWRPPSAIKGREHFFCDFNCYGEWCSAVRIGENCPSWRGGSPTWRYYGPNWRDMRERTLQRDEYRCCSCGVKEDELDAPLHVHHIRAFVDCDNWQEANQLSNLIALCPTCHGHLEHDEDFCQTARARIAHAQAAVEPVATAS